MHPWVQPKQFSGYWRIVVAILDVAKPQGAGFPCKAVKALDRYRTSDGASRFGTLGRSVLATTVTSGASPIA